MSFLKLPNLQRSYSSVYGCAESEAQHTCHDCPESRVREFARTRSGFFIKKAYLATLMADPTDAALWTAGIAAGDIIMLPQTSGSYDPGSPKELPGFGDRKVTYGPREMTLLLNDPDYADNYAFYNEIIDRTDLIPGFRTSSLIHIFDTVAAIKGSDPVADDLEAEVIWNVECKVVSKNLPSIHRMAADDITTVFSCSTF